ncbi:murein biosynthesis integral membrane protein MurJ [Romboutsia maritimum]|uniref:Probable lipid II flippase MurJ n=1 Tax=Romboutsia maritimum TaxID=2020948 RepID=A0A371IV10_9FIRM|nr:murein biosynthesis integral membrane protein MurJ [Romboutsia maritimum]RDY24308.1 murein biosynthesis integral membrane protein MurJ [Romboutsia maritimum]
MSKVAKAAVGLMLATLFAKILGFGRELALASAYGASNYSDAFLVALNIPNVIFLAVGTALSTAFIPLYCDIDSNLGKKESLKFTNNILNIVVVITLILTVIGVIFTEPIVKLFAVGFKGETLSIAVYFTRILILGLVFLGVSYIMTAFLQVKENFVIPGLMSIPFNLMIVVSIFLSLKIGPDILAWGTLLGLSFQFLFQLPFAIKNGFQYSPYINVKDQHLTKMVLLIAPVLVGVAVNQVNTIVDRTLASTLVEGSISALNYATKLNQFVMGMFIISIGSVIYPLLSKLSSTDENKFKKSIVQSINTVILIIIPISAGAIVLANPIVRTLFQRGEFDARATHMTALALIAYSIGMIGFGLRDILGRVFYSLQDTKTPMINGVIAMVLNIILNLILVRYMAHTGLALATSISALVTIVLLFISLRKKIGSFGGMSIIIVLIKSLVASIIMAIITLLVYNFTSSILGNNSIYEILKLGTAVLVGALSYGIVIILFKVKEVDFIIEKVKQTVKSKKR